MSSVTNSHYFHVVQVVVGQLQLDEYDHISHLINNLIRDNSEMTIEEASRRGCPRLLRRIATNMHPRPATHYVAHVVNFGISRAASIGDLLLVSQFCSVFPDVVVVDATNIAALNGHVHILDWLAQTRLLVWWKPSLLTCAVESDDIAVVEWVTRRFNVDLSAAGALVRAVQRRNGSVIEHLLKVQRNTSEYIDALAVAAARASATMALDIARSMPTLTVSVDQAASRGDMDYLLSTSEIKTTATTRAMNEAAGNGHWDTVKWLHHNRSEGCTHEAIDLAAARAHYCVVRWLCQMRTEGFTSLALYGAASNGHLRILKLLRQVRPEVRFPVSTFDSVCANGHIDVARYLSSQGLGGGSVNAMNWAAANNHLEMLEWLAFHRNEGCTTAAMDAAASNGHLRVVAWLHRHGQACTTAAMDGAARNGHLQVAQWLAAFRPEGCTPAAFQQAALSGHFEVVKWLHENQRGTGHAIDLAASSGNLALVKWFITVRSEICTREGMRSAASRGCLNIMEVLRVAGATEGCDISAFDVAVEQQNLYLTAWIAEHYPGACSIDWLRAVGPRYGWTTNILDHVFPNSNNS